MIVSNVVKYLLIHVFQMSLFWVKYYIIKVIACKLIIELQAKQI